MDYFPNVIEGRTFIPRSDATPSYNCISWVLTYERQAIWPDERGQLGWPDSLDRMETLDVFQTFFELTGFSITPNGRLEAGIEKIAVYVKNGLVTHAARQLANGIWTSKMGGGCDADHPTPDILCGPGFGNVSIFMGRINNGQPPIIPALNPPPPLIIRP